MGKGKKNYVWCYACLTFLWVFMFNYATYRDIIGVNREKNLNIFFPVYLLLVVFIYYTLRLVNINGRKVNWKMAYVSSVGTHLRKL